MLRPCALAPPPAAALRQGHGALGPLVPRSSPPPFRPVPCYAGPCGFEGPAAVRRRVGAGARHAGARRAGGRGGGATFASMATQAGGIPEPRTPPRVCVVGGGFGGLYTSLRMEGLQWPGRQGAAAAAREADIVLIDSQERFLFKPLMYELLTGEATRDEVAPTFASLLEGTGVRFEQAKVTSVTMATSSEDDAAGTVVLDDGTDVPFDYLVVALGGVPLTSFVPGAKDVCLPFSTLSDVDRAAAALDAAKARGGTPRVAVVGGGVSGAELAAAVASRDRGAVDVTLLCRDADGVMPSAPPELRRRVADVLARLGVAVRASASVSSAAPLEGEGKVSLSFNSESGSDETFDVVFWCAGQEPASAPVAALVNGTDLEVGSGAKPLAVAPTLQALAHPRVFAVGDVASVATDKRGGGGGGFADSRTAQVAFQQSDYAAWNVWATHYGRPLLPFRYQHLGEMLALGPGEGAVAFPQLPEPFGAALGTALDGWVAGVLRKAAYVYRQPTNGQRLKVLQAWASRPALWLPPSVE